MVNMKNSFGTEEAIKRWDQNAEIITANSIELGEEKFNEEMVDSDRYDGSISWDVHIL